jgi:hypothetical protein
MTGRRCKRPKVAVSAAIRNFFGVCFVAVAAISNRGALSIRIGGFSGECLGGFPGVPGAGGHEIVMFLQNIFMDSTMPGEMQIGIV